MSVIGVLHSQVILRLQRNPTSIPQWLFITARSGGMGLWPRPLCHLHIHTMCFGCGGDFTDGTLLRLALLPEVDGSLDPGPEIGQSKPATKC